MTGPEDDHSNTRPISVAELLARNGTIGAPPIGGRRRRRRGDTDSITVAELTGEIPVIRDEEPAPRTEPATNGSADHGDTEVAEVAEAADQTDAAEQTDEAVVEEVEDQEPDKDVETDFDTDETDVAEDDEHADAVADYQAHVESRDEDEDLDFFAPPRRSSFAARRAAKNSVEDAAVGAEQMSPDPLDDLDDDAAVDLIESEEDTADDTADEDRDDLPSYLRPSDSSLFGGPTGQKDRSSLKDRSGLNDGDLEDFDLDLEDREDDEPAGAMSAFLRGAWVVGQCVVAVAFGAGLFIAFDQLWKWNSIVALVLGVLVILGLVVGVRVVRRTEDIGSTLIAVAVGAMVTFGPLALIQAG
ncbi:hypothetical protein SAMN04489835_0510 [Mycolicibacterium rutilum]|uniref:Transmembrane protein n=1 Tax=Mycolicibacterium rutilum TaxID=370526 RepID=A0A1H6ITB7_MYCRU|nr:hypothetical protein [Mycolicibacterium rutilum]SEH49546.1 hypothetical protein SAMN04489835_0510 [Mycolicibacterium rutilum]